MGLFQNIYCAECRKKNSLLARTNLKDGHHLCSNCTSFIPPFMQESFTSRYATIEDFRMLKNYAEYSDSTLRPKFRETHKYYSLHIDDESGIFYIGKVLNEKTLFFQFINLEEFNLLFRANEFIEGVTGDKVYGQVLLKIQMGYPYFYYEKQLDTHVIVKAQKKRLGSQITFDNPDEMNDFLQHFLTTWQLNLWLALGKCPPQDKALKAKIKNIDNMLQDMRLLNISTTKN